MNVGSGTRKALPESTHAIDQDRGCMKNALSTPSIVARTSSAVDPGPIGWSLSCGAGLAASSAACKPAAIARCSFVPASAANSGSAPPRPRDMLSVMGFVPSIFPRPAPARDIGSRLGVGDPSRITLFAAPCDEMRRALTLVAVLAAAAVPLATAQAGCTARQSRGSSGTFDRSWDLDCGDLAVRLGAALEAGKAASVDEALSTCGSGSVAFRSQTGTTVAAAGKIGSAFFCAGSFLITDSAVAAADKSEIKAFAVPAPAARAFGEFVHGTQPSKMLVQDETVSVPDGETGLPKRDALVDQSQGAKKTSLLELGSRLRASTTAIGRPTFPGHGGRDPQFGSGVRTLNANCYAYSAVSPFNPAVPAFPGRFCHPGNAAGAPVAGAGPAAALTCNTLMAAVVADGMLRTPPPSDDPALYHEVAVFHHVFGDYDTPPPGIAATHYFVPGTAGGPDQLKPVGGGGIPPTGTPVTRQPFHDYHFHRRNQDVASKPCWSDKNGQFPPRPCFMDYKAQDLKDVPASRRGAINNIAAGLGAVAIDSTQLCGVVYSPKNLFGNAAC